MKKVVLFILLATIVTAQDWLGGQLTQDQYDQVLCEREKRLGSIKKYDGFVCCLNTNDNNYCENDEPFIGECFNGVCLWPTNTFIPWYAWRYHETPCVNRGFLVGKEYDSVMEAAGCSKKDTYWCCSNDVFAPTGNKLVPKPGHPRNSPEITGALMVLNNNKWLALEKGQYRYQAPEQRVLASERARCAAGGGAIRIIDPKYGSFFYDIRNIHEGIRAFYLTETEVIPLITWCTK